jgi:serine protease inhibitor
MLAGTAPLAAQAGRPPQFVGGSPNPQSVADSGTVYRSTHTDTSRVATYPEFSLGLFRTVARQTPQSNVFLSPASAAFALAMTATGAAGSTRTAMARTLGEDPAQLDALGPANASELGSLAQQTSVELHVANSVWASQDRRFAPAFLDDVRRWYDAQVTSLVLHGPAARERINTWVKQATNGKIDGVLQDTLPDRTAMVLVDAIYFKGEWLGKFDTALTKPHLFTLINGTAVRRAFMSRRSHFLYVRDTGLQMLRLPYHSGRIAMYVLLPDPGTPLTTLYARLDTAHWTRWMHSVASRDVHVELPKFHLTYATTLRPSLDQMGMGIAFGPAADFSGMLAAGSPSGPGLAINEVLQRTYVDVDEQGTEAAAVTAVGVRPTAVMAEPPPIEFVVDRPFCVAIRDDRTGLVLFLGQVVDPTM